MNKPVDLLPPFTVNYVMLTLAETYSYGHKLHNIPEEWKKSEGEGIIVSIIDTGLPIHRDLDGQIIDYANFTESPVEDLVSGHSTHCGGVVAAKRNNEGVVGCAPKSKLLIAKALGDSGSGSDRSLAEAIKWSVEKGSHIINMSLGAPASADKYFPETRKAILEGYERGVAFICAAGNENANRVGVPAKWDECISVAAINSKKQRANFSNKGPSNDFAAAGVNILSTYKNNSYCEMSGTSMATPYISGIAALVLSEHLGREKSGDTPINNPKDLREHIRKICVDLGRGGHDAFFGNGSPVFGHLNIEKTQSKSFFLI